MAKIGFTYGFMNPEGKIMSMVVPELVWESEKAEMALPVFPDRIIAAAQNAARKLVDEGGYIAMERYTPMIEINGLKTVMSYKTYITYLKESNADYKKILFSEKDGKSQVWFSFNNTNDSKYYKNFEAGERVVEDITALMLLNILATYNYSEDVKGALQEEIDKSPMYNRFGIRPSKGEAK